MRDEYDGRLWAENHRDITAGISHLLKAIMQAFCVLNNIEYAAPWRVMAGRIVK